ncbi:hypothetical protein C8A00DRAFT_42133 [Chaetomidium leptoderma]|uniref:RGS domain-containing protein n=1 Tax=Chaetomidium leptoderma TaxID=669021 RepID=A0AAN6VPM8_9PEZI|nr:hypothetical protein C8A00DRAFT_42133 [Chaetomidium leptoderma]
MPKAQLRAQSPTPMTPRPLSRESTTRPSSVLEDGDGDSIMSTSRPSSLALMPPASATSNPASPPSLRDILTNMAPPPYTLGAFTAFLSHNHCMETLEFTMDADRYASVYSNFLGEQIAGSPDGKDHVCSLWQKIINAYIKPYGNREVNLPAHVRDRLLSLPSMPVPPHPSELDEAVRIVYELMNDSVMGPFLAAVMAHQEGADAHDPRHARTRHWGPKDMSSSSDDSGRSPKMGFLPMLNIPWTSEPKSSASSSSDPAERAGLTDDSANTPSPTGNEPMTPPTTPPISDWEFSTSPGGLHKAINSHSSGWKKGLQVMPIPEDTVTASPDCASPAVPDTHAESDEVQAEKHSPTLSGGWEEPHPGQRYAVTVLGNARPGAANCNQSCNGIGKAGMAAKVYSPYPTRGWSAGTRRFAQTRVRTPAHRGLKTHISSTTKPVVARSRTQTPAVSRTYGRAGGNNNDDTTHLQTPAADPSRTPVDLSCTVSTNSTNSSSSTDDAGSYMSIDTDKYPLPIAPDDDTMNDDGDGDGAPDPYGWDAELEKRPPGVTELCPVLQYRRAGDTKRTLLQRVLSFGPSAPREG